MSFEEKYKKITRLCGWEHVPKDEVPELLELIQSTDQINKIIESLEVFTDDVMEDDAGDIADERWRLSTIISMILEQTTLEIGDFLISKLESTNDYTQAILVEALGQRKFKKAKGLIMELKMKNKDSLLQRSCEEALNKLS